MAARHIPRELGGAAITGVESGFVRFRYAGKPEYVAALPFISNSYKIILSFRDNDLTFRGMVKKAAGANFKLAGDPGGFRVRFSKENRFEKVPREIMIAAEKAVTRNCGIRPDRLKPALEFWLIIRRGGIGYFAQLLKKETNAKLNKGEQFTAKLNKGEQFTTKLNKGEQFTSKLNKGEQFTAKLNKGELRPELACLLCLDCGIGSTSVVCEPFAGYGAIPLYIQRHCEYDRMFVSDVDSGLIEYLSTTRLGADPKIEIVCSDAAGLGHIADSSVDFVITDPPWGFASEYRDIAALYARSFAEIARIIKDTGKIVVLTGKPAEAAEAARKARLSAGSRINILVNGKKASVFTFSRAG